MSLPSRWRRAASGLVLLMLAGCGAEPESPWFPLGRGDTWTYEVVESNALGERRYPLSIRDRGSVPGAAGPEFRRLTSDGLEYRLAMGEDYIERVAVRSAISRAPMAEDLPNRVLPRVPDLSTEWRVSSVPFILERADPFRERFSRDPSKRFDMRMRITSLDEVVETPAERFEHCLRVEGEGQIYVLADPRIGASPVVITQSEWYAPDVGLVKLIRTELLDTPQIVGGRVEISLTRHRR